MSKKMAVSQKIGDLGELIFEKFAVKNGLVPNKVKRDYGIDYVCQPTEHLSPGIRGVRPSLLGVNVRSSSQRRVRAKYSKEDIMQILKSDFPTLLILVDVQNEIVYQRFLDMELLEFFHNDIARGKQSITITPTKMKHGDQELRKSLAQVMEKKYQEGLRLRGMELRLSQLIGLARLSIQRSSEGSFAVVEVKRFEDIFKEQEDKFKVREVILATKLDGGFKLPIEKINRAIAAEMGDLAEKIAVIAKIHSKSDKLIVKSDENVVECIFEVRTFEDEFSFYHPSGLSIIFSGPREHEDGLYHHHFEVKYDDPSSEPLFNHKDIVDFLKNCKENATLHLGDIKSIGFELKHFPMLIRLGLLVSSLDQIYKELRIPKHLLKLYHIDDYNYQTTFGFFANLFVKDLEENIWPGFVIVSGDTAMRWVGGRIFCPVFVTIPEGMFIIMVSFGGKVALSDDLGEENAVGFSFDKYLSMDVEEFKEPPDKLIQLPKLPLMLICGNMAIEIRELKDGGFHQVKSPFDLGISYDIKK